MSSVPSVHQSCFVWFWNILTGLSINNLGLGFFFFFFVYEPFEKLPDITQDKQNKSDLFPDIDIAMFRIMAGFSIIIRVHFPWQRALGKENAPLSLAENVPALVTASWKGRD